MPQSIRSLISKELQEVLSPEAASQMAERLEQLFARKMVDAIVLFLNKMSEDSVDA